MELECRTCLKIGKNLCDLFSNDLPHKIEAISSVEILEGDGFSTKICDLCEQNVHLLYDFRNIIRRSNVMLQQRCVKQETSENVDPQTEVEYECVNIQVVETKMEPNVETVEVDVVFLNDAVKKEAEIGKENKAEKKVYTCKDCEFTTQNYNSLRTHKKVHKEVVRTVCTTCGKSVIKAYLRSHLLSHSETPISCEVCGKMVKNIGCLKAHMFIHNGQPLQCSECGKIYKNRPRYYAHKRRHALGDVKTVECSICTKLFFDKETLTKHIRSHTGERPFPCEYCKKGFSSSHALKTHKRKHTNEKPYACDYCEMAFPQRVSLRTHLKSKHPDKTEPGKS